MSQIYFTGQPAMGSQAAVIRTLTKLGLNVPTSISAAAQKDGYTAASDGVDNLHALSIRYPVWQVDAALAKTNLTMNQKVYLTWIPRMIPERISTQIFCRSDVAE